MNIISMLAVKAPKDLWTIMINWIQGAFGNYGWTILFFTLFLKLIMSPLDFWVKYTNKRQQLVQKKCSPQIAKLKKKFGANQEQFRIQSQALYKREGLKMGSGCVAMLVNMIAIWLVFFTLFDSLRSVSAYQVINQYETIEQAYEVKFKEAAIDYTSKDNEAVYKITADNYEEWQQKVESIQKLDKESQEYKDNKAFLEYSFEVATNADKAAGKVAATTWEDVKDDWLWVQNIWVEDAVTSPFPSYDKLLSIASDGGYKSYVKENIEKTSYTTISNHISDNSSKSKNGYFITPILVGGLTLLSQIISELHTKLKNKKAQKLATVSGDASSAMSMKLMKIIMPIIMVFFALSSSTSFGIYLFSSSLASLAIGEVTSIIINKLTRRQQKEVEEVLEKEANRLIKKGQLQEK